jgi:hypothetical protein
MLLKTLTALLVLFGGVFPQIAAQEATPLCLKVRLDASLQKRYSLGVAELGQLQGVLSRHIVEAVRERGYWSPFCWNLQSEEQAQGASGGCIELHLEMRDDGTNWTMDAIVVHGPVSNPVPKHVAKVPVFADGDIPDKHRGPPKKRLAKELTEWFIEHYLQKDHGSDLHRLLREIPSAKGVLSPLPQQKLQKAEGLVLLDYNKYWQFSRSKFKFLVHPIKQAAVETVESVATGGHSAFQVIGGPLVESLVVRYLEAPTANVMKTPELAEVYLADYPGGTSGPGISPANIPVFER